MRIIIELDQQQATVLEKTGTQETTTLITASDAGTPSQTLLQAVGGAGPAQVISMKEKPTAITTPGPATVQAIDAGTPPNWLVQALKNAPPVGNT